MELVCRGRLAPIMLDSSHNKFHNFFIPGKDIGADLMNCSFESSSWESELSCGLSQMTNDNFDWSRYSGSTPSSLTGPSYASDGSYYLYIETSSSYNNANAVLISRTFNTGRYTYGK